MIEMYPPKGGEPIFVLPQKKDEMLEKGWVLDKPKSKPTKESK